MKSISGGESPDARSWYALYTKARHEKRVDSWLRERDLESYLPLVPRLRKWHDRKKIVEFPMFPSYVFARLTAESLPAALRSPGVATVVRSDGRPVPIPSEEIDNVRRFARALADAGGEAVLKPLVEAGQEVRVVSGPFKGVEGTVLEQRARRAIIQVGIGAIHQGLRIELGVETLEPCSRREQVAR